MLCQLIISNIAVIGNAEIVFGNGFNVLTGETGAGKSLIIDSINLILGARTGRDIIRDGEKSARVDAAFSFPSDFFAENNITSDGNDLIISREIFADGRNMCKINGKMATVSELRELGEKIINIHGQNESISLLKPATHIEYLDKYALNKDILCEYQHLYSECSRLFGEIDALEKEKEETEKRLEILTFWSEEIENANLKSGEDEYLSELCRKLRNADKIKEITAKAYNRLYKDDKSAVSQINDVIYSIDTLKIADAKLSNFKDSLYDVLYKTQELARDIYSYTEDMSEDGLTLEEAEERLDLIHRLKNKYKKDIDGIIQYGAEIKEQIDNAKNSDAIISRKKDELDKCHMELKIAAMKLSETRQKAALEIEKNVTTELYDLDMQKVRFAVSLSTGDYTSNGIDNCEFMISTNPAEQLKPLAKIASGGEMSRVCLALKTVLSKEDDVPTLIFDEIDQGISGRAAQKTGEKLRFLAKDKQVLCITHLAQIASKATNHYLTKKDTSVDNFSTTIALLNKEGRVNELARIISGDKITEKTLQTAEEMLEL